MAAAILKTVLTGTRRLPNQALHQYFRMAAAILKTVKADVRKKGDEK